MTFLYGYPDIVAILILGAGAAVLCAGMTIVCNRFAPREQGKDIDLVLRAMTTTSAILTFVLAFSIVQAKSDLNKVLEGLSVEARALGELDRQLSRFDEAATSAARETLARYAYTVITEEWPLLQQRSRSPKAGELVRDLTGKIETLEPKPGRQQSLFTDMSRASTALEMRRDDRIFQAANTRLPGSFWVVIVLLFVTLGLTGAFLKPTYITTAMVGTQAAMFGVLAGFLFILDEPFLGQTSASPQQFIRAYGTLSKASVVGGLPSALVNLPK
jgi:hypothetical protein